MSIIYTLIANKIDNVVCEYTNLDGNFPQITRIILNKEVEPETTKALQHDKYTYHYINENKITFLAFSEGMSDSTIIAYLKDIKANLYKEYQYENVANAQAYQLSSFSKKLKELSEYYKDTPRISIGGEIIKDLGDIKNMMTKNISNLLDRGKKLDIIVKNAESLKTTSETISGFVSKLY